MKPGCLWEVTGKRFSYCIASVAGSSFFVTEKVREELDEQRKKEGRDIEKGEPALLGESKPQYISVLPYSTSREPFLLHEWVSTAYAKIVQLVKLPKRLALGRKKKLRTISKRSTKLMTLLQHS